YTGSTLTSESGLGWLDAVHSADRDNYLAAYRSARQAGRVFEMEYRLRRRDGVYRWVVDRSQPYIDEAGTFLGYIGFTIDTTDRRQGDSIRYEIEEQVHVLGLATRDWVWSWDARTDRILHNESFS